MPAARITVDVMGMGMAFAEAEDLLTARYGVPTRPLPDENAILLLEALGAVRRRECTPESPPRMVAMRYVLDVVAEAWEVTDEQRKRAAAASFYAANERRRPRTLARLDLHVIRVGGKCMYALRAKRIEVPDLQLWVPMASLADALYGSSRDTNCVRREIEKRLPDLARDGPHRWNVTTLSIGRERFGLVTQTLTRYAGLGSEVEGEASRGFARTWGFISALGVEMFLKDLPGRDASLLADFKRQRLVLEGADPVAAAAAVPAPVPPARRVPIFGAREWLTDTHIANVLTLILRKANNGRVRALYPMSVDILASGGTVICPVSTSLVRRGAEKRSASGGHWTLLVLGGAKTRYWDSLGEPCDPSLLAGWSPPPIARPSRDHFQ
eukprot:tig00000480_g1293.t1